MFGWSFYKKKPAQETLAEQTKRDFQDHKDWECQCGHLGKRHTAFPKCGVKCHPWMRGCRDCDCDSFYSKGWM